MIVEMVGGELGLVVAHGGGERGRQWVWLFGRGVVPAGEASSPEQAVKPRGAAVSARRMMRRLRKCFMRCLFVSVTRVQKYGFLHKMQKNISKYVQGELNYCATRVSILMPTRNEGT